MEKYLIINADDFGMCKAHNLATVDLFNRGAITSATVMAPCPFASSAVKFAAMHPELSVGVHLTTTSEWKSYRWGPLSKNATSMVDSDGCFFRNSSDFASYAKKSEVEEELVRQIEALRSMGLVPSHLDNHMGSLYGVTNGDFGLLELVICIAGRYGLPFRFPKKITKDSFTNGTLDIQVSPDVVEEYLCHILRLAENYGVLMPDYLVPGDWKGPQDQSYENFREYIYEMYRSFENGVTETYIHPAVECDEIKEITPFWHRRVWEYKLFSDPMTLDFVHSNGIKLIGYRELQKINGH